MIAPNCHDELVAKLHLVPKSIGTRLTNGKKDFYWGKWQLTLNFVNEHSTWSIDMRFVRVYHVFC